MPAVTLAHVAKLMKDPLSKGIIQNLLRASPILEYVPFENVDSLQMTAIRWTNLPDVTFRRINEDYTAEYGDVDQIAEALYGFGGKIEIDRVFPKISGSMMKDPVQLQIEMTTKSMAYKFSDYFVNGDHATDVDGFEGLKKRVSNLPSRQKIRAGSTTDVLDPTASAANARRFLDKFAEAIAYANDGDVQVIHCNKTLQLGLGRVLRYAGISGGALMDVTKDQFDRKVYTFDGIPLVDAGLKKDNTTEIIPNDETADDAGTDATSAYFIPFNMEHGVHGGQLSDIEIERDVYTGKTTTNGIMVEWWVGLTTWGSYGPTRLYNIETPASWT